MNHKQSSFLTRMDSKKLCKCQYTSTLAWQSLTMFRPLEATNVWVRLYWRSSDHRARILFLTLDASGRRMRYCFPLTGLKVLRTESCLQLCRVNREDGKLDLWANLRFPLYESMFRFPIFFSTKKYSDSKAGMVLFYCTVVAMKRQDQVTTSPGMEDFFQPGEKEEYGG